MVGATFPLYQAVFRHVTTLALIRTRTERSQVMRARQLIGQASAELPLHCRLRGDFARCVYLVFQRAKAFKISSME